MKRNDKNDVYKLKCLCHRSLIKHTLKESECIFCDKCDKIISKNDLFWSCPKGQKSHKHEKGHNICKKCCIQEIVNQFQRKQAKVSGYSYYKDDDRLPSFGECGVRCLIQ